jgi:hypothetical protein
MYKITITELKEIQKALKLANNELLKTKSGLFSDARMALVKSNNITNSYISNK